MDFTILIVENEKISSIRMNAMLLDSSDKIFIAPNGIEANEFSRNNPGIDLVLMDIKMPEVYGLKATRKFRECYKEV